MKYENFLNNIKENMSKNNEYKYFQKDIEKLIGQKFPKSYQNKYYLNGAQSPIGRFLKGENLYIEVIETQYIVKRKNR